MQKSLTTSRLTLRPFRITDAKDVQKLAGDFNVADTTLNIPHPYEDGMAENWIATHTSGWDEKKSLHFAICISDNHELI
jgi:[ribosomal protein S5]-alanine N-acetyltransferase